MSTGGSVPAPCTIPAMSLGPHHIQPDVFLRLRTGLDSVPEGTTARVASVGYLNGQWYFTVRWNRHYPLITRFGQTEKSKRAVHANTPSGHLTRDALDCFELSSIEEWLRALEAAIPRTRKKVDILMRPSNQLVLPLDG